MKYCNNYYKTNNRVLKKEVDGNLLVLLEDIGELITLNETAKEIYIMITKGKNIDEIEEDLISIYDVDEKLLQQHLKDVIDRFIELGILIKN